MLLRFCLSSFRVGGWWMAWLDTLQLVLGVTSTSTCCTQTFGWRSFSAGVWLTAHANARCSLVPPETSVGLPETSVGYWKLPRADKRTVAKISIHSKRKTWEKELHERARPVRLLAAYSRMPGPLMACNAHQSGSDFGE